MGVGWARFIKQPRLSSIGQILAGTSVGWLGALYGKFRRVKLHIQVVKAMENPAAFSQALENISQRIGEPLPPALKIQVRNDSPKQGSDEFGTLDVQVPTHAIVSRDDRNTNSQSGFGVHSLNSCSADTFSFLPPFSGDSNFSKRT